MPGDAYITQITNWFTQNVAGSQLWAAIGLAAVAAAGLAVAWVILRGLMRLIGSISSSISSRRRRQTQGYTIGVARFAGARGGKLAKALIQTLQDDMSEFSFGAQYEVIKAPAPIATQKQGLRDVARRWLGRASSDLIIWGYRGRGSSAPLHLSILSCEGSLTPAEAQETQVMLPGDFAKASDIVRKAGAYLVARALQPGLARATAFRAEKLEPVADVLAKCLANPGSLPDETISLLETDYCAMGLHIGTEDHLIHVAELRRARLASEQQLDTETQIAARIDLGRALLGMSAKAFDPARVREAMDHLKAAVELLKLNPTIQFANHTANAVQQGQALLQARQRFSVTGGGGV